MTTLGVVAALGEWSLSRLSPHHARTYKRKEIMEKSYYPLMSAREAARMLRVGDYRFNTIVKSGKLPYTIARGPHVSKGEKIHKRFRVEDVKRYKKEHNG